MGYGGCPHNDDGGGTLVSNSYMTKLRLDIKEDAGVVEELASRLHQWGYGFERRLQQAKGGVNMNGDPAAQTFAREWNQLKWDFDSYMGDVSSSNRLELEALWREKDQFETRLKDLPRIVQPHYPKPPKAPEEKPDEQKKEPSAFVVRGAHDEPASDGSHHPPSSDGRTRRYPILPIAS